MTEPPPTPTPHATGPATPEEAATAAPQGLWSTLGPVLSHLTDVGSEGALIRRNVGWLLADRGVRLFLSLAVNVWLIRYLGAEWLGLMSFTQSLVVLFAVLGQLGLETILVRDLVRRPAASRELLGTSLALRLTGSLGTMALSLAAAALLRPGDSLTFVLTLIFTSTVFSQSFDVIEYWFQSRSTLGPLVAARMAASATAALAKAVAIVMHAPLEGVALVIAGEYALSSLAQVVGYRLQRDAPHAWRARRERAVELLSASWPLILNGVAIVISVRVDQMIITTVHGPHENGIYAAAQRLTEIIYYIPVAVMAAATPALLRSHQRDAAEYARRLQRVFSLLALTGLGIAATVSLLAGPLVRLLFGAGFAESGPVLAILAWTAPMLFLGVAQTNWFIAHDRQTGLFVRSAVAAAVSVALNVALVPWLGARGAAVTMLASQSIAQVLLNACFAETRPLFRMQCRAFLPLPPR